MKIDVKEATVESNVSSDDSVDMGISAKGVKHIMSLLTNLYNDPELAVVREYYSNALDSHIRAKQSKPVEVTLPSWGNPLYTVKDYGTGMSETDIKEIYSQYGASTKQDSNDESGAFGLGCKSALALATQFTLYSIKDSVKLTVLVSKTPSGINSVNIVSKVETNEPNGVTVTIPVSNHYSFNEKAYEFFKYSGSSLVLVNGRAPDNVVDTATKIYSPDDENFVGYINLESTSYYTRNRSYVIMGNVPYSLDGDKIEDSYKRLGMDYSSGLSDIASFFYVGIGDVDLTPNREGLRFTEKTMDKVDYLVKNFQKSLEHTAEAEMQDLVDKNERHKAFELSRKWSSYLDKSLTWDGEAIPSYIKVPAAKVVTRTTYGDSSHTDSTRIFMDDKEQTIVTGHKLENYKKVSNYLSSYLNYNNQISGKFIFIESMDDIDTPWILENDMFTFITGDKIIEQGKEYRREERKKNKDTTKPPAEKMKYPVVSVDTQTVSWTEYTDIPDNSAYIYAEDFQGSVRTIVQYIGSRGYGSDVKELARHISAISNTKNIVLICGGRKASALENRVKTSYNILEDIKKSVVKIDEYLTDDVNKLLSLRKTNWYSLLSYIDILDSKIEVLDEDIKEVLSPSEDTIKKTETLENIKNALYYFSPISEDIDVIDNIRKINYTDYDDNVGEKYKLLETMHRFNNIDREHLVHYINAIYQLESN